MTSVKMICLIFFILILFPIAVNANQKSTIARQPYQSIMLLNGSYQDAEQKLAHEMFIVANAGFSTLSAGSATSMLGIVFSSILPHLTYTLNFAAINVISALSIGFGVLGGIGFLTGLILSVIGFGLVTRTMKLNILKQSYIPGKTAVKKMNSEPYNYHEYAKKMRTIGYTGLGMLIGGLASSSIGIIVGCLLLFQGGIFGAGMPAAITVAILTGGLGGVVLLTGMLFMVFGFGFISKYINYKRREPKMSYGYIVDPENMTAGIAYSIKF